MLHASKFSLLAKCVRQFGVVDGVKLGARLATGRGEFAVRIPAYREPVLVRAGTSDATVFVQIFADREYESEVEEAQEFHPAISTVVRFLHLLRHDYHN